MKVANERIFAVWRNGQILEDAGYIKLARTHYRHTLAIKRGEV